MAGTARQIDRQRVAKRRGQWLRLALAAQESGGKTHTALWIAFQLGNRVLVIDTEISGPRDEQGILQGASELFDEHFPPFTPYVWEEPYDPRDLAATIAENDEHYDVIVVDSSSPFYDAEGGTLEIVQDSAARHGGNQGAGWRDGTPAQNEMVRALQRARCHVIFTMRSKTLWNMSTMEKVGVGEVQRPGLAYDFTLAVHLDRETHDLSVEKSRVNAGGVRIEVGDKYKFAEHPKFMADVMSWLGSAEALQQSSALSDEQGEEIEALFEEFAEGQARNVAKHEFMAAWGVPSDLTEWRAREAIVWLRAQLPEAPEPEARDDGPEPEDDEPGSADDATAAAEEFAKGAEQAKAAKKSTPRGAKTRRPAQSSRDRAAAKKTPAKKGGAKKAAKKPGSGARKAQDKPPAKKRADTPETPEDAPEGNTPVSEETEVAKGLREYLLSELVHANPDTALAIENRLVEASLWPIDKVAADELETVEEIMMEEIDKADQEVPA